MVTANALRFNIIYTPGTVKYLLLFTLSLLRHSSDCTFRILANGCTLSEVRQLTAFCASSTRLEFANLGPRLLPHASVLNQLYQQEDGDYFCFMDSDIFATGDFLPDFLAALDEHVAVFSSIPIWQTAEAATASADVQKLGGRYFQTADGFQLGVSYFGIYDNRVLNAFTQRTGVDFERCAWVREGYYRKTPWGEVPEQYKPVLAAAGLQKQHYDTTKLLNILLQLEAQQRIAYLPVETLQHIGGIASNIKAGNPAVEQAHTPEQMIKQETCGYVLRVLDALFEQRDPPPMPAMNHPVIEARLHELTDTLVELYETNRTLINDVLRATSMQVLVPMYVGQQLDARYRSLKNAIRDGRWLLTRAYKRVKPG